ncbi:hypothetical protein GQX74_011912 [Glossina fuscipes]|nr:hypothetical protein GQX74_011912 [Glossina fuscipes]
MPWTRKPFAYAAHISSYTCVHVKLSTSLSEFCNPVSVLYSFMLLVFMSTLFFIMYCQQTAATELRPIGKFFRLTNTDYSRIFVDLLIKNRSYGHTNVTSETMTCKRYLQYLYSVYPKGNRTRALQKRSTKFKIKGIFLEIVIRIGTKLSITFIASPKSNDSYY